MVTDTKFRLALSILLLAYMLIVARNVFGQGMMGTFPLPKIVGMTGSPVTLNVLPLIVLVDPHQLKEFPLPKVVGTSGSVTLDVQPMIVLVDPHQLKEFRVRFRIEPNGDNREYSYAATCGAEVKSSIRKIDQITYTMFEHLTVLETCVFEVCVSRVGIKKPLCARRKVPAEGG